MDSQPFRDQVAIVTGASAGIGRALAMLLAGQGAKVAIAARRSDRLEALAAECRQQGGEVLPVPTDVGDETQCKALVERTIEQFGRLDLLINNAGLGVAALLDAYPDLQLFKQVMDVNFYGAVHCTYFGLPFLKQSRGRIVAISSLGGKAALPYNTAYIASKFAMHGFYDALRMEVKQHGVSVTVVCPSWVVTEFHEAQMDQHGTRRGPRGRAIYSAKTMTAEQCAQIVLASAYKRRRETLLWPGPLAAWLKLIAPGFLDWLTIKVFLEPAVRRARAGQ